jgi:hypothetical protein
MNAKRFYYISLGAVAVLVLLLGGSIYYMNQFLQKGSDELVQAKLASRVDEEREKYYLQAKKDLEKYKDISATLVKVLPKDKDQAKAVAEIGRIADESGIEIKQISFPSSTLGEKKAAATTTTTNTTNSGSTTPTSSTPSVTQAKPVEGVTGVLGIDTQVQFISTENKKLTYTQLITFLEKIEKNRRTMQVSSISITPKNSDQIDAAISLRIFVKP